MPLTSRFRRLKMRPRKALAPKAKRQVRSIVKSEMKKQTEYKQYSVSQSPVGVYDGTVGVNLINVTLITQGVADNNRVGDEINLKWIEVKMFLYNNTSATANAYTFFRVIIFQYNYFNNAPKIDELLLTSAANGGTTYGTFSSRNIDYLNTYHVLYDKTVKTVLGVPNASNYASNEAYVKSLNIRVPLKFAKKKIQYLAASTSPANGIWMLITTGQGTVASDPVVSYNVSTGFTD